MIYCPVASTFPRGAAELLERAVAAAQQPWRSLRLQAQLGNKLSAKWLQQRFHHLN